ncbi:MAG: tetratricopeptide repeat protein [Gammaproteobacteria bacterium]
MNELSIRSTLEPTIKSRPWATLFFVTALAAAVAGCEPADQPSVAPSPTPTVSDRPNVTVDLSVYPEDARARAAQLIEAVNNAPNDGKSAGLAGMFAHAYEHPTAALQYYTRAAELESDEAAWPYLKGVVLEAQGDDAAAMSAYTQASKLSATYPPLRLRMAELQAKAGRTDAALVALGALTTDTPRYAQAHYAYGKLALDMGDSATAIEQLQKATESVPHYGAAHYSLAAAYEAAGREELAATHRALFEKHRRAGPPDRDRMLTRVQDIRNSSQQAIIRAGRLSSEGKFREAIEVFEALLSSDPENLVARVNLIGLYGQLGETDQAQANYDAGLAIDADAPKLHSNYGVLMLKESRFEDAVSAFEKALAANPDDATAHKYLGVAQQRLGQSADALTQFGKAFELDPLDYQSGFFFGNALIAAGQFDRAADTLENIVEPVSTATPTYLRSLAQAHFSAGNLDNAGAALNRARELATRYNQTSTLTQIDQDLAQLAEAGGGSR